MSKDNLGKRLVHRYFIDGFSGMALGLFATLIIGLILKQLGSLVGFEPIIWLGTMATVMTGIGIGVGVANKFQAPPLVMFASTVTGFIGAYAGQILSGAAFETGTVVVRGPGEPLGAFIAVVVGVEIGRLVAGKTKLDIVITPMVVILAGGFVGLVVGPPISSFMSLIGAIINTSAEQQPFIAGLLVSPIMGIILTLPISSAALSIILGLKGYAAGAATVGCAANMVGFAVASYRENKVSGLLAQGLGTSMLQVPNIVKNPRIFIPPILTSIILGPLATVVFKMENNPAGGGMGTSGLVGQLMTWQTMSGSRASGVLLLQILLLHFILPAILTLAFSEIMRKKGMIKFGDMKLDY